MKLSLKQYEKTVTIETERDDLTMPELANEFMCLAMAQDYHPEVVKECVPDQDFIDSIVYNAINEEMNQ